MATAVVTDWNKKEIKKIDLSDEVFGLPLRKDLLQEVVKWQLASRRQGTHKTKTRSEVRGGGKKPFKQKGTGNARQGTSRSPLMPGGAIIFGPTPRDYSYSLPKKVKQNGLKHALSYLFQSGKLHIVDGMASADGKTNELGKRLNKFGLNKAVLVDSAEDASFKRASRNLKNFRYYSVDGLNVYDLLKYDNAIVTQASLNKILTRCGVEG